MEEKLVELETKFSYQEDMLSGLNDIVIVQQRQLDDLLREMALIKHQLLESAQRESGQRASHQDEKPPHY